MTRIALATTLVLVPAFASAATFSPVGARALAMGGTGVAAALGPTASYWNPAAMAMQPATGSFLWSQGTADPEDLADDLDSLAATGALLPDILSRPLDALRAVQILSDISSQPDPITGSRAAGAFYGGGLYAFSLYRLTYAQGTPLVDRVHTALSDDPATGLPYNESRLLLSELRLDEYVGTLAFDLGDPNFVVGANVRYARGTTWVSAPSLFSFPDFAASDIFGAADDGEEESNWQWSFDVGAMVSVGSGLRFGVIGKYLGTPEYETALGDTIEIPSKWRTGVAIFPAPGLTLTGDIDIASTSLTSLAEDERDFSVGAELLVAKNQLALRGGYRDSVSGPSSQLVTGGVGFIGGSFGIDATIAWSPNNNSSTFAVELSFLRNRPQQ